MSTIESNQIVSGQTVENTLQLNQQGGGRIDIPLPERDAVVEIPPLIIDHTLDVGLNAYISAKNVRSVYSGVKGSCVSPFIINCGIQLGSTITRATSWNMALNYNEKPMIIDWLSDKGITDGTYDFYFVIISNITSAYPLDDNSGKVLPTTVNVIDGSVSINGNIYALSAYDLETSVPNGSIMGISRIIENN